MGFLSFLKSPEDKFWSWFQDNDNKLFHFEQDQDAVFDELSEQLVKVNDNLTFEFGPILDNGKREFVISADGIRAAFPVVEKLHKSAPNLERWTIIKFRPRRIPINDLKIAQKDIKADNVHYLLFKDEQPDKVGILLFFEDYLEEERNIWGQAGFLLLDEALGEYDVETKVGAVTYDSISSKYFEHAQPLKDLALDFDNYFSR